ncbi:MAG: ATP-binding protein [Pseudomonadota bacterium]
MARPATSTSSDVSHTGNANAGAAPRTHEPHRTRAEPTDQTRTRPSIRGIAFAARPFAIALLVAVSALAGAMILRDQGAANTALFVVLAGGVLAGGIAVRLGFPARREKTGISGDSHSRTRDRDVSGLAARVEVQADQIWQLEEIANHYRSVVDSLGDVVIRRDASGKVIFVNECYELVFGLPGADVLGRELVVPGLSPEPEQHSRDAVLLPTRTGERWFAVSRDTILFDGSEAPVYQTVLRDVTDQRATERALIATKDAAEAASDAKSRFLATVSHEIRTPLNGILGMSGLLLDTELSSEQATYARAIGTSGRALLSLIEDMLDFSKIEAGRIDLAPQPTRLDPMIEDLVELLAPRAQAKDIVIGAYVAPGVPDSIMVDPHRLRQVLLNLAGNAIKFTETGGVAIDCTATPVEAGRATVRFAVSDTGIGIDDADRERIFTEFEQAEHGPTRRFDGTGLGLAISRRIVRHMGGDIAVAGRKGAGTTFSFELPADVETVDRPSEPGLAGKRVAVLSTSTMEAVRWKTCLEHAGAEVLLTESEADIAEPFDVVLIDAEADRPAVEHLATLREGRAEGLSAAIILRPADRSGLDTFREAGFQGYLVKPVRRASLLTVTARLAGIGVEDAKFAPHTLPTRDAAVRQDRSLSILLVEDNPINAMLARAMLEKMGHAVRHVTDGGAAIDAVAEAAGSEPAAIDCVLMDLHMPGIDGRQAIREIRRFEQTDRRPRVPIIALTADTMADTRDETMALGADGLLTKPVEEDDLRMFLAQAVLLKDTSG